MAERVGPQGTVLGVDISAPMLARARERQSELSLKNVEFLQADAQTHRFEPARFDLVYSRFGVIFFENPAAAFANPHRVSNVLKTAGFTRVNLEPHEAQLTMGEATTVDEAVDFTLEIGPMSRLLASFCGRVTRSRRVRE